MMASGCLVATTSSSHFVVKSPSKVFGESSIGAGAVAPIATFRTHWCSSTGVTTNINGVRRSNPSKLESFKACSPTGSMPFLPSLNRLSVSSLSHLAATPVGREVALSTLVNSRLCCSLTSHLGSGIVNTKQIGNVLLRGIQEKQRRQRRPKAKDDDFEIDDDGGFEVIDLADLDEDDEEDFRDYETEYEAPTGEIRQVARESESFINTEGEAEETVVAWKINEDEFHKISLLTCDFFIRKVPDPDDDVYDFREMYVTPPDTDIYSIPKVDGNLPKKPVRCTLSNYEVIHTTEPPVDEPRAPLAKTVYEVMKVFLTKHYKDRRANHENFVMDFEEVYVIDNNTKSFHRADVKVDVSGGVDRDRTLEVLIVRDGGTSFRIIPEADEKSPDEVIQEVHWEKTREAMENYLRGFRDYEKSNWF